MKNDFKVQRIDPQREREPVENGRRPSTEVSRSSGYATTHPNQWKSLTSGTPAFDPVYDVGQLLGNFPSSRPSSDPIQDLLGEKMIGAEPRAELITARSLGIEIPDVPKLMELPAAFDHPEAVLDKLIAQKKSILLRIHGHARAIKGGGLTVTETERLQSEGQVFADALRKVEKQITLAEEYVVWDKHREAVVRERLSRP